MRFDALECLGPCSVQTFLQRAEHPITLIDERHAEFSRGCPPKMRRFAVGPDAGRTHCKHTATTKEQYKHSRRHLAIYSGVRDSGPGCREEQLSGYRALRQQFMLALVYASPGQARKRSPEAR